jgi:serine/threonine-protein kinase
VPAALLAVLAGWAVLSQRTSGPSQPAAAQTPVGSIAGSAELPRQEPERLERLAPSQVAVAAEPPRSVTKQTPAAPATARLALAVAPWGEVYVDGSRKGTSPPLAEIKLAPGKHTVEIRNTTFQPYAKTVELDAEGYLKIKHKFQ